jgi:GTP-binding protein
LRPAPKSPLPDPRASASLRAPAALPQPHAASRPPGPSRCRCTPLVPPGTQPAARPEYVVDKTFDLFCELGASDEQTDFPIVYTSAINRQSGFEPDSIEGDMSAVFKQIMDMPKPKADADQPLQLQISNIGSDPFIGRLGIGRIKAGKLTKNTPIGISEGPGTKVCVRVLCFLGS